MASIVFEALLLTLAGTLMLLAGYWALLTVAAACGPRRTLLPPGRPSTRFAILVPAHDEEQMLPELLASLAALDYPSELARVHVVADNCSDRTAEIARAFGADVHERIDGERLGKGYALDWLWRRLEERPDASDAVIVVDADSVVSPNFLRVMDARLAQGERAIQGYYAVRRPAQAWTAALRAVALALRHYVRPLGRMGVGASAGLMGNGMAFSRALCREHRWSAALTEDIEYHLALILAGERVSFAPDAVVLSEMPASLRAATTQNVRWEAGRREMLRRFGGRLIGEALRRRSFVLADAAIDLLAPPVSIVSAAVLGCLIAAVVAGSPVAAGLALAAGALLAFHVFGGLILVRAPAALYRALLFTPLLVVWKLALYARLLLGLGPLRWVRTERGRK
jgi:cellulose synthase/poly-beta-1,6-N-acetylglucosamine synthase-like glycosyltransferase